MLERSRVIAALAEGTSINATVRMNGVAKHTILKLLKDVGSTCAEYHNRIVRNVNVRRAQFDEIWAFCYAKEKNLPEELRGKFGYGDVWTWMAIDADTRLIRSYIVGALGSSTAHAFMRDLSRRVANRFQLTTDGHRVYADAVERAFGSEIDYSMLVKLFGNDPSESKTRYSPATCIGCRTPSSAASPIRSTLVRVS